MADLIDREKLYMKISEFEVSARHMVEKLKESEDPDDIKECAKQWLIMDACKSFKRDLAKEMGVWLT